MKWACRQRGVHPRGVRGAGRACVGYPRQCRSRRGIARCVLDNPRLPALTLMGMSFCMVRRPICVNERKSTEQALLAAEDNVRVSGCARMHSLRVVGRWSTRSIRAPVRRRCAANTTVARLRADKARLLALLGAVLVRGFQQFNFLASATRERRR